MENNLYGLRNKYTFFELAKPDYLKSSESLEFQYVHPAMNRLDKFDRVAVRKVS